MNKTVGEKEVSMNKNWYLKCLLWKLGRYVWKSQLFTSQEIISAEVKSYKNNLISLTT